MKLSKKDLDLLDRHYLKIKFFGRVFYIWNTSPRAVLEHLKELIQEQQEIENQIK